MKKLLNKDKKLRVQLKKKEILIHTLQLITNNLNFSKFLRWKAFLKIKKLNFNSSNAVLSNRCIETVNKKRFNKFTMYSRQLFLKLIREGKIYGYSKSSW